MAAADLDVPAGPTPRELSMILPSATGTDAAGSLFGHESQGKLVDSRACAQPELTTDHTDADFVVIPNGLGGHPVTAESTKQHIVLLSDGETDRVSQRVLNGPDPRSPESCTSSRPWHHDQNVLERPPTPPLLQVDESTNNSPKCKYCSEWPDQPSMLTGIVNDSD